MPLELTIIAVTALLAGLLLVGITLAGRGTTTSERLPARHDDVPASTPVEDGGLEREEPGGPDSTLRVAWWLTITIVLLGVGISGSFAADQAPIFILGGAAVFAVVVFHELVGSSQRGRLARLSELVAAIVLIGALLALTGFASSPFVMLFALVAVAAALAFGPRAGLTAAVLSVVAFGVVLAVDPDLATYGAADALRLSIAAGATLLLAFVSIAYAGYQRRMMQRAVDLSRTDPLTGLFNRSQLYATLEQEVSRTRRSDRGFCVLMIDLDGLKAINDSSGHLRGDEVLRAVGQVIHGSIRTVDSAYRFGGDEFVVLLPETDIVGAFVVAEKIRLGAEELGSSLTANGESPTSVSIGLVSHPEDGLSAEELMRAADRAMYQAKKLGKNQISGNPRPRPALLSRRAAEAMAEAQPVVAEPELTPSEASPQAEPPAAPQEDRAVAVELGPVVVSDEPANGRPESHLESDEEEADPTEVRRRIAAARRSFDPDHQIRRAMDAFFSPGSDPERPPRDH